MEKFGLNNEGLSNHPDLERPFSKVNKIGDIYDILDSWDKDQTLPGTSRYTAEEVRNLLDRFATGEINIEMIPRTAGLRRAVAEVSGLETGDEVAA